MNGLSENGKLKKLRLTVCALALDKLALRSPTATSHSHNNVIYHSISICAFRSLA